jgi:dam-replacing family
MIERITSNHNPDFFFMSYSKEELRVTDFFIVPKHFFVPEIIEKRNPLPDAAQRAGWIGCNILIDKVPEQGKIAIVSDGQICNATLVAEKLEKSGRLVIHNIDNRGWILDILQCVNAIPNQCFSLNEVYVFEAMLQAKHPQNQNVKPKIRQQLQILRDRGFIEFLGNGYYRKAE